MTVKALKRGVRSFIEIAQIAYGMWKNARTGHTPKASHIALVSQFTRSGGRLNDRISKLISLVSKPYKLDEQSSLIPLSDRENFALIQEQMLRDGYYIFDNRLPEVFCDRIAADIADSSFIVRDDAIEYDQDYRVKYNRQNPIAPNYMLSADDTTDVHGVQELVADPTLVNVAQNYLRAKSIFTGISLYWSAKNKDVPDMKAAQAFHWDMERIRWIRFFICLTDVNEDSGPHCFIKGTHKTGGMPESITSKGYVRHTDEDVIAMFGKEAYIEFTCKKGTIIAEDSRGLHKGKVLKSGERLMLAFELSNSTFGADKRHRIRSFKSSMFEKFAKKYPKLYGNFDF